MVSNTQTIPELREGQLREYGIITSTQELIAIFADVQTSANKIRTAVKQQVVSAIYSPTGERLQIFNNLPNDELNRMINRVTGTLTSLSKLTLLREAEVSQNPGQLFNKNQTILLHKALCQRVVDTSPQAVLVREAFHRLFPDHPLAQDGNSEVNYLDRELKIQIVQQINKRFEIFLGKHDETTSLLLANNTTDLRRLVSTAIARKFVLDSYDKYIKQGRHIEPQQKPDYDCVYSLMRKIPSTIYPVGVNHELIINRYEPSFQFIEQLRSNVGDNNQFFLTNREAGLIQIMGTEYCQLHFRLNIEKILQESEIISESKIVEMVAIGLTSALQRPYANFMDKKYGLDHLAEQQQEILGIYKSVKRLVDFVNNPPAFNSHFVAQNIEVLTDMIKLFMISKGMEDNKEILYEDLIFIRCLSTDLINTLKPVGEAIYFSISESYKGVINNSLD